MTNPFNAREASQKIAGYLANLIARTGLSLTFDLLVRNGCSASCQQDTASGISPTPPSITVEFAGPDTTLLLARNGELLHAIEHLAAKILHLEPEAHDLISFDAEGFKSTRDSELAQSAELAIQQVRATGQPFAFAPMTSRERRMLHLLLTRSGLPTASSGEVPRRFVVLYPEGASVPAQPAPGSAARDSRPAPGNAAARTEAIRNRFRRR